MPRGLDLTRNAPGPSDPTDLPLGGTRSQSVQRLQFGIGGVVLMVLLVGLASLIQDRTREVDAAAVPAAAPTTEPSETVTQNDPLVEAGVVPDLPDAPSPTPSQSPAVVPEQATPENDQRQP
ncbi:hypothetical protein [Erythrobacter sp. SD-21]|uniref:hypothetical protein n=1 Tax=Erythrobacter sp. SD-21 TaxID=161528 RepID=UPI000153FD43|nr:hypothetical protein [Erythrobacter sp. SD-21]EDL48681.1 hypothetical protein ED21_30789 [Erythrobacter sp. SD-21]